MAKIESIADVLNPELLSEEDRTDWSKLSGKAFLDALFESQEFKTYVRNGLVMGDIPPAILCKLMDYAWGKPVDRVEVRGELVVSKVVREIVDPASAQREAVH